jgi:hypothetical protein
MALHILPFWIEPHSCRKQSPNKFQDIDTAIMA